MPKNLRRYTTEHHNGKRFRNIWGAHPDSELEKFDPASGDIRHRVLDVASWILRKGLQNNKQGEPATVNQLKAADFENAPHEARAIWLGHASVLLQVGGVNILTDPVFGDRVSPVSFAGPKRLCPLAVPLTGLPRIDAIVLSHNHYDHTESDTLKFLAKRDNPAVFSPLRTAELLRNIGFSEVHELDWWQQVEAEKFTVTCLPAKHFSGRSAIDRNETLWASFMISFHGPTRHVYFAGDTAYSPHFREIASEFPDIHLTLMPIGAYLPRWFMREVHVSPEEAILAYEDLAAQQMLGIHWGTYDLADEDWDQPRRETIAAAEARKLDLSKIKITGVGEPFFF